MSKTPFEIAMHDLMAVEGGYSNVATDRGGETYKGISRKHWPDWDGWHLIDEIKTCTTQPTELDRELRVNAELTLAVCEFYLLNFWNPLRADSLPDAIAFELFDTAVNQGLGTAGKYFQEAVNLLNKNATLFKDVAMDGKIGPMSLAAFDAVQMHWKRYGAQRFVRTFIKILDGLQFERYRSLAERHPDQEYNFYGWISNRIGNSNWHVG